MAAKKILLHVKAIINKKWIKIVNKSTLSFAKIIIYKEKIEIIFT